MKDDLNSFHQCKETEKISIKCFHYHSHIDPYMQNIQGDIRIHQKAKQWSRLLALTVGTLTDQATQEKSSGCGEGDISPSTGIIWESYKEAEGGLNYIVFPYMVALFGIK